MNAMDIKLDGYHGTINTNAVKIMKTKTFFKSSKNCEWLGYGIYFFGCQQDAEWWANNECKKSKNKLESPSVLKVLIKSSNKNYFDLDIKRNMSFMHEQIKRVVKKIATKGTGHPEFKNDNEKRCYYCNLFIKLNKNIQVLAYTFPRTYKNDMGFEYIKKQRQLCVNDSSIIKNMEVLNRAI